MRYPIHAEDRGAQCAAPFDLVQATYEFSGKEYLEDAAHFFSIDIPAVLIELSRSNIAIEDDDIDLRDRISNKRFTVVVSGPGFEESNTLDRYGISLVDAATGKVSTPPQIPGLTAPKEPEAPKPLTATPAPMPQ